MSTVKKATKKVVTTDQILNSGNKPNKAKKPMAKKQVTNNNVQDVAAMQEQIRLLQQQVKDAKKANGKKVVYFASENETGKSMQRKAKGLKTVISQDMHSISFCINRIRKFVKKDGQIWNAETRTFEKVEALGKVFVNCPINGINPANVLKYRTDKQMEKASEQLAKYGYERYTVAMVLALTIKYLKELNGYVPKVK